LLKTTSFFNWISNCAFRLTKENHHPIEALQKNQEPFFTDTAYRGIILFIFVAIVIAFISPIAKYAIEKYDVKIYRPAD
jgi:hypothetical protein